MPLTLEAITVGWPPSVTLKRTGKVEEALLHERFVFLEDKRLLRYGYGRSAGITSLEDLRDRIDAIRDRLLPTLTALPPRAPISDWLGRLAKASHQLLNHVNDSVSPGHGVAYGESDLAGAVDQLRAAFATVAGHVGALYKLPAARRLADQIRQDLDAQAAMKQ